MNTEKTERRTYHGKIDPEDLARALAMRFDEGDTKSHWMHDRRGGAMVQIQTRRVERDDPTTTITVHLSRSPTGIAVSISEQKILGVAADLAKSGLKALLRPASIIAEIDDVARNVRRLNLRQEAWKAIEDYFRSHGSGRGVVPQLSTLICEYCGTPNELAAKNCQACHAPLSNAQPLVCSDCGYLNQSDATRCTNCGAQLSSTLGEQ